MPAALHISPTKVKASPLGEALDGVIPADDDSAMVALGLLWLLSLAYTGIMLKGGLLVWRRCQTAVTRLVRCEPLGPSRWTFSRPNRSVRIFAARLRQR